MKIHSLRVFHQHHQHDHRQFSRQSKLIQRLVPWFQPQHTLSQHSPFQRGYSKNLYNSFLPDKASSLGNGGNSFVDEGLDGFRRDALSFIIVALDNRAIFYLQHVVDAMNERGIESELNQNWIKIESELNKNSKFKKNSRKTQELKKTQEKLNVTHQGRFS